MQATGVINKWVIKSTVSFDCNELSANRMGWIFQVLASTLWMLSYYEYFTFERFRSMPPDYFLQLLGAISWLISNIFVFPYVFYSPPNSTKNDSSCECDNSEAKRVPSNAETIDMAVKLPNLPLTYQEEPNHSYTVWFR